MNNRMWLSILAQEPPKDPPTIIKGDTDAYNYCKDMGDLAQESFHILSIGGQNRLIERTLVSIGSSDRTMLMCRDVFRVPICCGASAIVVLHNHPSGDPTPSNEDISTTRDMIIAGQIMGIPVLDHLIVVHSGYLSMKEEGVLTFGELDE